MRKYIDDCASLDINWLRSQGKLWPPTRFSLTWRQAGIRSIEVNVHVKTGALEASWADNEGDDGAKVEARVKFCRTRCHFGGSRPWFCCPRCRARCGKVYFARHGLVCRRCLGLAYRCQSETLGDRSRRIARRIRRRLGAGADLARPLPFKPRGMHWRTYETLVKRCSEAEETAINELRQFFS